jgi:predicted  nucleic acid-binding Zn-ribbon protein
MEYRIMYCDKCGREYKDVFSKYGENCIDCGTKLKLAWKVEEKEFSCVKSIQDCRL